MRAPSFRGVDLSDRVRRRIIVGAAVLFAVVAGGLVVANVYVSRGYFADLKEARAVRDQFAFLSRQHTNACSLQPTDLAQMAAGTRLRGSCCTPIDLGHYARQIAGLRAYAAFREVPSDPYDIPVALARRLTSYQKISLGPVQQGVYRRAVSLSREHGPCCCRCRRWYAFEGQAHELIARLNWHAGQVAALWDLEDGCGGKDETA
jgi:hypothetical protein